MVLFIGAESGSVLVFVEVKFLVGFGFCKSLKVGILYRTYEKVSRPGPCNFNGDLADFRWPGCTTQCLDSVLVYPLSIV